MYYMHGEQISGMFFVENLENEKKYEKNEEIFKKVLKKFKNMI